LGNKQTDPLEWEHQASIFEWAAVSLRKYPKLKLLNGSLNGVRLTIGQAVKAKRAGMKKGYPDIFLPVARGGYYGLYIELKREFSGSTTREQKEWLADLAAEGHYTTVCKGSDAAIKTIIDYLEGKIENK
jgi:hypothetical protein